MSLPHPSDSLTELAQRADAQDPLARATLFETLYDELHKLAQSHVRKHAGDFTLSATTLLHEAYLSISKREALAFPDRSRFFAYASRAMRGLVIDYVRERRAMKRGGDLTFTTLADHKLPSADGVDHEKLGVALDELAKLDAPLAELVDLKFYCGLNFTEIAAMRGVSDRTVQRDWAKARVLLHEFLNETERDPIAGL